MYDLCRKAVWLKILLLSVCLAACQTDYPNHQSATIGVISNNIVMPNPDYTPGSGKTFAWGPSPGLLSITSFQNSGKCDGSAGSVLPPLSITCGADLLLKPLHLVEDWSGSVAIGRTVGIPGLQKFLVQQGDQDLCWAAALESERNYLRLRNVSFRDMPKLISRDCPDLLRSGGATGMYQIAYVSHQLDRIYDGRRPSIYACNSEGCIISALEQRRPVIALKASHAVLIQAVAIAQGTQDMIRKYYVLDPNGNGSPEERQPEDMCLSDGFLIVQ